MAETAPRQRLVADDNDVFPRYFLTFGGPVFISRPYPESFLLLFLISFLLTEWPSRQVARQVARQEARQEARAIPTPFFALIQRGRFDFRAFTLSLPALFF